MPTIVNIQVLDYTKIMPENQGSQIKYKNNSFI